MYFTADPHFGHSRLIPWRPFSSIEAWNNYFIDRINSRVPRGAILWILGDFAFGGNNAARQFRQQIRCKDTRLILGNHDPEQQCRQAFKYIWQQRTVKFKNNRFCFLSHYPTLFWNKSHHGAYHLHGHVHSQRQEWIEDIFPDMRILDVSPDNYERTFGSWDVFTEDEVIDLLEPRQGHDHPSFYQKFQSKNWENRSLVL